MNKIWVSSDFHFNHNKPFLFEPRGFSSIFEHDKTIISNFIQKVDWTDDLYLLGDHFLGQDIEYGINCLSQIPGKKHFIWGNHCTDNRKIRIIEEAQKQNWDILGYATIIKYNGLHFYLSHYPTLTSNWDYDKPLKARVINLCGHMHTTDRFKDIDKGLIYHCELDAHNCFPVSMDQICDEIREYYIKKQDAR